MTRKHTLPVAVVVVLVVVGMAGMPISAGAAVGSQAQAASVGAGSAAALQTADTHSLRINSSSGLDGGFHQSVSVQTNTSYTLSGWIKTQNVQNGGGGNGAQFNVHGYAESTGRTSAVTGTSDWTYVEVTVDSGSSTSLQVNALFGGWGTSTGTAWYDDVRLENPSGTNLLTNGDLESGSQSPWTTTTWSGSGTFQFSSSESHTTSGSGGTYTEVDTTSAASATFDQSALTIDAAGTDVWTGDDQYGALVDEDVSGDVVARTTVASQENTHAWAKAGIMFANDASAPGSSAGDIIVGVSPGNGYFMQWDSDGDGFVDSHTGAGSTTYPADIRVTKSGTTYTGEYSTDGGSTWTQIDSVTIGDAASTQDVALFATSHSSGTLSTVDFNGFSVDGSSSTSPPAAPSSLSSPAHTNTSVDLSWTAPSDTGSSSLDHYNVYVDGSLDHQVVAGSTSSSVTGLSPGTSYDFTVTAVNADGLESNASNSATVTTDADTGTAPAAPSSLSSPGHTSSSVDLSWTAPSDTGSSSLDHYNVYVDGAQDHQVAAGTTSTTVTGLASSTSYDFTVTAVNADGLESSASNVATVTTDSTSGSAIANRAFADATVEPGESTTVTVTARPSSAEDFSIVETFNPAFASVTIVDADGASVSGVRNSQGQVFATYSGRSTATLTYEITMHQFPTDEEGQTYSVTGFYQSHTRDAQNATGGAETLTVARETFAPELVESTRTISTQSLATGGTTQVTVEANPSTAKNFTVVEEFPSAVTSVTLVNADNADYAGTQGSSALYATYSGRSSVTLTYEITVGSTTGTYDLSGITNNDARKGYIDINTTGDSTVTVS